MKRRTAGTVSILAFLAVLVAGADRAWAGGGACGIPSCRPHSNAVAPAEPKRDAAGVTVILLDMWVSGLYL